MAEDTEINAPEEQSPKENASGRGRLYGVLNTVVTAVLVLLLGFVVYVTVSAARGRIVGVFGRSVLVVVTGSMEPSIHVGDYIFIERVSASELKEGDIIAFYSEAADISGMLVTHRITALNEDGTFVTRGDANPVEDSVSVRPERIVGRYIGKARFFHWASSFGDSRKLLLLLVMIPTVAAAIYEIRTIAKLGTKLAEEKKAAEEERERYIREAVEKEKARLEAEGFKGEL